MSIRPTIRRATVAGAVAALSLSLLPALATSAAAANPSPNVAFTFLARHSPAITGDGKVLVNAPADLTSAATDLLPSNPNTFAYSFDVSDDGDTAAYLVKTTDAKGDFYDTSSGLVVVDRGVSTTTAVNVATWVDTNPVVSPDGTKVWWMTEKHLYQYDVALGTTTDLGTAFAGAETSSIIEFPQWLAVSDSGTSVAVLYDRFNSSFSYLGARVYAAKVSDPTNFSYNKYVADTTSGLPGSSTFAFTDDTHLLYSVNATTAAGFDTATGVLDAAHNNTAAGIGTYYQVYKVAGTWYVWKDDTSVDPLVTSVGTTTDLTVAPTEFWPRTDGDRTTRYVPSTVAPPAVPATLDTAKSTFTAFLNLSTSTVSTNGKAYFLAGGQWGPVGPDPAPYQAQQNFKGELQYSYTGSAPWTKVKTTTGAVSTGPNGAYNGLTQSLTRNTYFRWYHPADLFTNAKYSVARKVSVKPTISISKAVSGGKTKVYGKIARVGGTAVLYKKTSTGSYAKVASVTISSTGSYSFGYRSLSRGTYRVTSVGDSKWATNYKNFTI